MDQCFIVTQSEKNSIFGFNAYPWWHSKYAGFEFYNGMSLGMALLTVHGGRLEIKFSWYFLA